MSNYSLYTYNHKIIKRTVFWRVQSKSLPWGSSKTAKMVKLSRKNAFFLNKMWFHDQSIKCLLTIPTAFDVVENARISPYLCRSEHIASVRQPIKACRLTLGTNQSEAPPASPCGRIRAQVDISISLLSRGFPQGENNEGNLLIYFISPLGFMRVRVWVLKQLHCFHLDY
jgi:hypothetical protein